MKKKFYFVCFAVIVVFFSCATHLENLGTPSSALSMWTDESEAKEKLISFVESVTNKKSADYIAPEDRIAVFDFDGTLFCETDPNYFDYTLLVYRVLEDPSYKDKASAFEREVANKIVKLNQGGKAASGLELDHGKAVALTFKGMTLDEITAYIENFMNLPMPSYENMRRGNGFYQPMIQVIQYLISHDFKVFIVSGTDRFIVRAILKNSVLKQIMPYQIIGSDETVVAKGQNSEDGLNYTFKDNDEVITGGVFVVKNLKMNKVSAIVREIGKQPVLCFGNSSGDSSMAEYTITGNPNPSLAFMLCCDDLVRENGNMEKAEQMLDLCRQNGWIAVSMKNDWTTIYADNVNRKN